MRLRKIRRFRIDLGSTHIGDSVYWGDREVTIVNVNRESEKILISGRKKTTKHFFCRWIPANQASTRPRKFANRKFRSIHHLVEVTGDGVADWFPTRLPNPTDTAPGSGAKIEALRERIERGEMLWHPEDSTFAQAWRPRKDDPAPADTVQQLLDKLEEWRR